MYIGTLSEKFRKEITAEDQRRGVAVQADRKKEKVTQVPKFIKSVRPKKTHTYETFLNIANYVVSIPKPKYVLRLNL
jgi:hypothetical protein